jgi:hypothetical protein
MDYSHKLELELDNNVAMASDSSQAASYNVREINKICDRTLLIKHQMLSFIAERHSHMHIITVYLLKNIIVCCN